MADMLARHGLNSPNARAHRDPAPFLLSAAQHVIDLPIRAGMEHDQQLYR
jgi:hypothetical protein